MPVERQLTKQFVFHEQIGAFVLYSFAATTGFEVVSWHGISNCISSDQTELLQFHPAG